EAENYDIARLVPVLIASRPLAGADDLAAVILHRLRAATTSETGSTQARRPAKMIAGLIYEFTGSADSLTQRALEERRALIEQRAQALAEQTVRDRPRWLEFLGTPPVQSAARDQWMRNLHTVTAYRDRHGITDPYRALGDPPQNRNQSLDAVRAQQAVANAARLATAPGARTLPAQQQSGPRL
ncbi:conjugal transfer protein, partial [Microbacterium sp. NPDC078428]